MTVVFVNSTRRWGGVKSWTLRVGAGLAARGHRVVVFPARGNPFAAAAREAGLEVVETRFGPDYNPLTVALLRREFARVEAGAAVVNVSKDVRAAGPACRWSGIPVVQRVGRSGDIRDRARVRFEQRRWVDRVVTPARAIRDDLARFPWMRAAERVAVIPNGVDLERFAPGLGRGALRAELATAPGVPILVTASQLLPHKGHAVLLEAMARAAVAGPPPVLAVIGTGSEEPALRRRAADLGLGGRVRFLGFRNGLDRLLEDAAAAVLPSLDGSEGFPNSVVEFLAKGKAVAASRVAGVPEAVTDGVEGLLVPPGDPAALAGALERILNDGALRARLGAAARARAEREFGDGLMVDRMEALLAGVAAGAGEGR